MFVFLWSCVPRAYICLYTSITCFLVLQCLWISSAQVLLPTLIIKWLSVHNTVFLPIFRTNQLGMQQIYDTYILLHTPTIRRNICEFQNPFISPSLCSPHIYKAWKKLSKNQKTPSFPMCWPINTSWKPKSKINFWPERLPKKHKKNKTTPPQKKKKQATSGSPAWHLLRALWALHLLHALRAVGGSNPIHQE